MLVSLITVSYNSEKTIKDTIESVLAQTYPEIEYFVIDGASEDKTVEIAESYRSRFAEKGISFTILSEKDRGIYDAMNKGIALSSGKIVGLINSDDWYEPIAVETAVKAYEKEAYGYFFADLNVVKPDGSVVVKRSKQSKYMTTRHWNHPTSFVAREVYDKIQYGCNNMYDDYDFFLQVNRAGYKVVNENTVIANYRFGGTSSRHSWKRVRECIRYRYRNYRKNGYSRFYLVECVLIEMVKYMIG